MTRHPLTSKNVEFQFGEFVQATEPPKTPNSKNNTDIPNKRCDLLQAICQGVFWVNKLPIAQLVHRNYARPAHSSDAVASRVEHIAVNENMPTGLIFGDRYGNTTILDYDTDADNDRCDDISDGDHSETTVKNWKITTSCRRSCPLAMAN